MASYIIDLNDDMISKMRTDSLKKFRQNYDSIIEKYSQVCDSLIVDLTTGAASDADVNIVPNSGSRQDLEQRDLPFIQDLPKRRRNNKSDWCSTLHKKKKKKRTHFQRVRLLVSKNKQLKHKFSRCNIRRAKIRVLMKALTSQKIPDLTSLTRNCEKLSLLQKNFNSYASLHSERIENTNVDVEIDPTKKVESGPLRESVIPVLREVQSDLTKSVQQTALYYHAHCNNIKNLASPIHSHWQSEISYVPSTSPCSQVLLSETTCWNDVETSVCDDVLQIELDSEDETLSDTIVAVPQDSKSFFDDSVNKNKDNVPQTPRRHTGGSQCHKSLFVNFYEHDDDFSAYKVLQLSPW